MLRPLVPPLSSVGDLPGEPALGMVRAEFEDALVLQPLGGAAVESGRGRRATEAEEEQEARRGQGERRHKEAICWVSLSS